DCGGDQGQNDHLEGPGSIVGPVRCPWYFFIGFFEFGQGHRGPMIPYCLGAP
ncbi:unnamed protein product, partial [Staurois parvus]